MILRSGLLALLALATSCVFDPPGDCTAAGECGFGGRCEESVCVYGCDQDAHCAEWEMCNTGSRQCQLAAGRCLTASHCNPWEGCDSANQCVLTSGACSEESHCAEWQDCIGNACVVAADRCETSADCAGLIATCDSGHQCSTNMGNGNDLVLFGTLLEGGCPGDSVSRLTSPGVVKVGFPCHITDFGIDALGTLHYIDDQSDEDNFKLRRFVPDPMVRSNDQWHYPADPVGNDPALPTPPCDSSGGPTDFVFQSGTHRVMYTCVGQVDRAYFDASGARLFDDLNHVFAWNGSGAIFAYFGAAVLGVIDADGTRHPIVRDDLPPAFSVLDARTDGDGFLLALRNENDNGEKTASLYRVDATGTPTLRVKYGPAPPGLFQIAFLHGVLDDAGALYTVNLRLDPPEDVVVKHPAGGSPGFLVYNDANAPARANDFSAEDFVPYNIIHVGEQLLRGP